MDHVLGTGVGVAAGNVLSMPDESAMAAYARMCGAIRARAQARSGDRIAIASHLGKGDTFDQAIAEASAASADQNERHYGQRGSTR
jgi:hypothetical protein